MIAALRARWFPPRPLLSWRRRRIDIPAVLIVIGALLLAAFLGEVAATMPMRLSGFEQAKGLGPAWLTAYLPWLIAAATILLPAVLVFSVRMPMTGLVVTVMLIFEVVPSAFQPRLPVGGGRLQAYDLLLMLLALVVVVQGWVARERPLHQLGPVRWPLYYLAACVFTSLVYVRYFAPNTLALGEARVIIGWLIVPIMVLSVKTPQAWRWMLRWVLAMGIVIALYVSIQSLFEVRIMTGARVELLDKDLNNDVVRSIAGGGVYLIVFSLFLLINRVLQRQFGWWWAVPAALLLVFGIAVQFGRGVWLSTAAGLLVSAALFRGFSGVLKVLAAGAVTVALMLSAASVFKPRLAEAVIERAIGIGSEIQTGGSFNWRRMENQAALDRIERNPVFGVGLGGQYKQTASSEGHFGIEGTYIHNGYLFFPLKMGLIAAFIPFAFMIAFARVLRQGAQRHAGDADPGLVAALAGAFAVPCVASYTQPEWADPRGIAAFAIFCGLALLYRRFGAVQPASAGEASPARP